MFTLAVQAQVVCSAGTVRATELKAPSLNSIMSEVPLKAQLISSFAEVQLRDLAKRYPAEAQNIDIVTRMHTELVVLFRNGQNAFFGSHFYQAAVSKLESLADAIRGIKTETAFKECVAALDHDYYFVPFGKKLVSLQTITNKVAQEVETFSGGYAHAAWGDFYQNMGAHSN